MSLARILMLMADTSVRTSWRFRSEDSNANVVLSNGNRTMTQTFTSALALGSRATPYEVSSGKWYVEATAVTVSGVDNSIGLADESQSTGTFVGAGTDSCGYRADGAVYVNGSSVATYATYTSGDVIGVAVNVAANRAWFSKNGVWQSGDPAAGTGGLTITTETYYLMVAVRSGGVWTIPENVRYAPPSGFRTR